MRDAVLFEAEAAACEAALLVVDDLKESGGVRADGGVFVVELEIKAAVFGERNVVIPTTLFGAEDTEF